MFLKVQKTTKMKIILTILISLILIICFINYLIYRQRKVSYLKASKKWDAIVKELRERK